MGNCQAAEAAAVVIQHPGGKVERLYGAATAGEVMRSNPGHYVALVVLRVSGVGANKPDSAAAAAGGGGGGGAKITKVKLLKATDTLMLGQVYRLITSQVSEIDELIKNPFPHCFSEVAKAIQARRQDKTRRCEDALDDDRRRPSQAAHDAAAGGEAQGQSGADQDLKRVEKERSRGRSGGGVRGRHWRPSLQSITESAS
ncbi:hypothetical protein HU200_033396 [Digitaria exilis]|uniref:Uncharacterized protein n=1 Tax=Digitaria exilis TaxID=1010633 RepID=A0A835BXR9_9POAL|nr:hypothetical protein HU200_033396 [Digitaria exilis]CAB3482976.1 unnamed protein product [Digitaria exilis]